MKKNVIFVIVFAACIVGLVQLHSYSQGEIADAGRAVRVIAIKEFAELTCPLEVEERSDIPFGKLIDPESRKHIADSVDVEKFRPTKIFLAKGFDDTNAEALKSFSNIIVNANVINGFDAAGINAEAVDQINQSVKESVEQNALQTGYRLSEWTVNPISEVNGAKMLQYKYIQNGEGDKTTYMILTYLFRGDKQIEVLMSAIGKDYSKWTAINTELVQSIVIK